MSILKEMVVLYIEREGIDLSSKEVQEVVKRLGKAPLEDLVYAVKLESESQ